MTEQKQIINALYHSGIDTLISATYIMLGKKFFKFKSPDAGRYSVSDMGLIAVSIAAADTFLESNASFVKLAVKKYAANHHLESRSIV